MRAAARKMPRSRPSDVPTTKAMHSPTANGQTVWPVARISSPEAVNSTNAAATLAGDGRMIGDTFMLTICQMATNTTADSAVRT